MFAPLYVNELVEDIWSHSKHLISPNLLLYQLRRYGLPTQSSRRPLGCQYLHDEHVDTCQPCKIEYGWYVDCFGFL